MYEVDNNRGPWITMADGKPFYLADPMPEDFDIKALVGALGRTCRFSGHLSDKYEDDIYSIAQHSIYVEELVRQWGGSIRQRRAAILHDLPEGAYHDVASPLKSLLPDYKALEFLANVAMQQRFDVDLLGEGYQLVHKADKFMGMLEARELQPEGFKLWADAEVGNVTIQDIDPDFYCWGPKKAKQEFLLKCEELELI